MGICGHFWAFVLYLLQSLFLFFIQFFFVWLRLHAISVPLLLMLCHHPNTGWLTHLGGMPPSSLLTSIATNTASLITSMPLHPYPTPSATALINKPSLLPPTTPAHHSRLGMILSPASSPIPFRLVQRIQAGEFVEMRDLMADNVSLHSQLEDLHGLGSLIATPAGLRPRLREVPSLSSWMFCFAAYMAVRTRDPLTRDMLAYCHLIIREVLRHGNNGWQEYDWSFCRQVAIDNNLPWNMLLSGLQAATLTTPGTSRGSTVCTICREPDHVATQCALIAMQQPVQGTANYTRSPIRPPRIHPTYLCLLESGPMCLSR